MTKARLLVFDDPSRQGAYSRALAPLALKEVSFASDGEEFSKLLDEQPFDAVVVAVRPPRWNGLELLPAIQERDASLPSIMIAAPPSVEIATASLRLGVADYLSEPLADEDLAASVSRVLERRRLDEERVLLRRQVERPYTFDDIIGTCPAMRRVYDTIVQVADSDVDVLVVGETGTGKELVARSLHRRSRRSAGPFVPVDCGAIPESLLESEFFGHERGAFTGADSRRIGLLEFADGGTFFLDELGELPPVLQAKLLRTLQERRIRRVGGREEIDVDLRIVAATARNLESMIQQDRFRKDLYYRINVVRIDLPPLAERGDDLGLLAEYFAARYSREMQRNIVGISPEAYQVMAQYDWPGNVRELQNVIRRAIALARGSMIGLDDLPDSLVAVAGRRSGGEDVGYFQLRDQHMARFERQYLDDLLRRHQGDVKSAALEAKLPRGTLYRLMKGHGIEGLGYRRD